MKNDAICTKGRLDWECSPKMMQILEVIQEGKWLSDLRRKEYVPFAMGILVNSNIWKHLAIN